MASSQTKLSPKQESSQNGKLAVQHELSNGTTSSKATGSPTSGQKEKNKELHHHKRKLKSLDSGQNKKEEQTVDVSTVTGGKGVSEPSTDEESPRTKLRNRDSIAKPHSLKYEPDFNRGFHAKIMQNLYVNSSKKKKKKKDRKQTESPEKTAKRKSTSGGGEQENIKKAKTEETEVFDSYKFSLNLINGEVDTSKSSAGRNSKDKYVLFIGNLPHDITREQLEEHFRKTGGIKAIRIPREKGTEKGRGFAYMEFDSRISHGIALRLHQTTLGGRKINVEFTSIGGGKSEARREKLRIKNKKRRKMKMNY